MKVKLTQSKYIILKTGHILQWNWIVLYLAVIFANLYNQRPITFYSLKNVVSAIYSYAATVCKKLFSSSIYQQTTLYMKSSS